MAGKPSNGSAGAVTNGVAAQDGKELQAALVSKLPAKIDIGPMYNVDPARRTAYTGQPRAYKILTAQGWVTRANG